MIVVLPAPWSLRMRSSDRVLHTSRCYAARSCHHCNRSPHRQIPLHPVTQYNLQNHPPDAHASMPTYRFSRDTLRSCRLPFRTYQSYIAFVGLYFSSSRSKTLLAPACAMTILFNCWLTWLMGMLKLLLKVKKLASLPKVNPAKPPSAIAPPTIAHTT